ncbi:putative RING-type E3 ubiquitin transferase C3H69 isoform X1 [Pyrus x bretschneideri]|uniref:putative RING-type E3 ubiquitin transferase C3H69 isoform X1 n=1 Tax=Pyrus x bretschneideri TaxID=225117 RepID=UPI00202E0546|nr:putative RING-type E3 ubiquitin transferase C3H69 isoform X1 [Pyrus x bretschneideri]
MSKRVLCKFFAHGACLKGEHCEFSHDWKASPNNICTFYLKGACAFGSRCRYEHVKASRAQSFGSSSSTNSQPSLVIDTASLVLPARTLASGVSLAPLSLSELSASSSPFLPPSKPAWNGSLDGDYDDDEGSVGETRNTRPEDRAICSFAAAGNCPRGEKCPHIHGDICPSCGKHCLHPYRHLEREEHMKICKEKQKQLEALKCSQEIECSVCLERVLSKPTVAERKFGILSECDHPFCISCIRNWRSSSPTSGMDVNSALRACPICRKLSYFVIPSVIWYKSKEEKQEIVDSYKARLRSIDCKHFDFGNGNCPFGTSCFYKHTVKPGSYVWKFHRPPPRRPPPRRPPPRQYDIAPMDVILHMFEHLEELDDYIFEDLENEVLNSWERESLMQMGLYTSDSSEDEIDLWP